MSPIPISPDAEAHEAIRELLHQHGIAVAPHVRNLMEIGYMVGKSAGLGSATDAIEKALRP